jgi:NitT/TauT family transport system permease protein
MGIFFQKEARALQDDEWAIRTHIPRGKDLRYGLLGLLILALVWCVFTFTGWIPKFFLPSPIDIYQGMREIHERHMLLPAILRSSWRVAKALFWVTVIGVPIGMAMGAYTPIDAFLRKIINGAKSVPPSGILGLVVLWFSANERGKVVFLFLGAIFFMIILVKNAVQSVSEDYVRVAIDLGATPWRTLRRVLLPGALPQIWDAIAVCNGIMWTYIVLVEFLNANTANENLGLGVLLRASSVANQPGKVFGVLILIALISTLTDFAFQIVRKRFLNW